MKIRSKDDELELQVYSRFLFRFWGFMFTVVGLIFLLPMLVQYQISCDEKSLNHASGCTLNTSFFKIYKQKTNLGELKAARVSNYVEGRANSIFYCLLLKTSEGYIKLPNISSKRNLDILYSADIVDNYIKTSLDKSINIPKVESWLSYFKVILFLLLGSGSLLFRLITIRFSIQTNTVTIAAKNIINSHETKIPLSEIDKLIYEEYGKHHKEYSLALLLKNGQEIYLPGVHDSNLEPIEAIAEQIKPFIEAERG